MEDNARHDMLISPLGFDDDVGGIVDAFMTDEDELMTPGVATTTMETHGDVVTEADPSVISATASSAASTSGLYLTNRLPLCIYLTCDDDQFSPYQVLLRKQIELFEAGSLSHRELDVVQGRNKPVVLGQVGIRCMHCRHVCPKTRGAVYYPNKLISVYQAAQNMVPHFLQFCEYIPKDTRESLLTLSQDPTASSLVERTGDSHNKKSKKSTGGKEAWARRIQALGVYEDEHGLRFEKSVTSRDHQHPTEEE